MFPLARKAILVPVFGAATLVAPGGSLFGGRSWCPFMGLWVGCLGVGARRVSANGGPDPSEEREKALALDRAQILGVHKGINYVVFVSIHIGIQFALY